ncbi:MAG TPA: hypothetical protein VFE40_06470 [Jatrophihabitantaceae bacterium]|jgi:hypothetical protein|nr:hypothetical protein [Jatrophihabitantaceae bacterium]
METQPSWPSGIAALDAVIAEAIGRGHRKDPVAPRSGGPAGNARLTSWAGLALLVVIVAELVTLLNVSGLIRWHVGIGIVLTVLALLKTASTGWRIVRYYTGAATYGAAGPPPTVLRLLGPLVIVSTLGVLGSGYALTVIGQRASESTLFAVLGYRVSPLTLHQGFFILFAVVTGLHLLARFTPAALLVSGRAAPAAVPGRPGRIVVLVATALAGLVAVLLLVPTVSGWHRHDRFHVRTGHGYVSR